MNAELVKQTLCTEIPKEVGPELDKFLEKTCNQLRKIESTEMTATQLAAQNILLAIPKEKANELRAALRIRKGLQNATEELVFDEEDLSSVIQESITNNVHKNENKSKKETTKPAETVKPVKEVETPTEVATPVISMQTVSNTNENTSNSNRNFNNNNGNNDRNRSQRNYNNNGYSSDNSNRSRGSYNSNHSRGSYSSDWRRDNYRRDSRGSYNSERYNNNNGDNFSDRGSYISDRGNGRSDYNSRIETQTIYNTVAPKESKCKLCGE